MNLSARDAGRFRIARRRCGRRERGSFASSFLTFSLLLLVMALGFVFGRVVIARAYVKTTSGLKKTGEAVRPEGQALARTGAAGAAGEVQSETAATGQVAEGETASDDTAGPNGEGAAPSGEQNAAGDNGGLGSDAVEAPAPTAEVGYAIQIGAFESEASAHKAATRLTRAGYPATIEVDRQHNTYKVLAGRFPTEEEARRALEEVQGEGFPEAFVVAR